MRLTAYIFGVFLFACTLARQSQAADFLPVMTATAANANVEVVARRSNWCVKEKIGKNGQRVGGPCMSSTTACLRYTGCEKPAIKSHDGTISISFAKPIPTSLSYHLMKFTSGSLQEVKREIDISSIKIELAELEPGNYALGVDAKWTGQGDAEYDLGFEVLP